MIIILSILAFCSMCFCIWARYRTTKGLFYLFKPLTTILIIAVAVVSVLGNGTVKETYSLLVIAALVFCLIGDVVLMLDEKIFIFGLISFAVAHILFSIAFFAVTGFVFTWWLAGLMTVIAIGLMALLLPHVEKIKVPVIIYILLISLMIWLSWERLYLFGTGAAWFTAAGSLLFGVSDTTLALNKFKKAFRSAELIILGTYFPAIWCIAVSI